MGVWFLDVAFGTSPLSWLSKKMLKNNKVEIWTSLNVVIVNCYYLPFSLKVTSKCSVASIMSKRLSDICVSYLLGVVYIIGDCDEGRYCLSNSIFYNCHLVVFVTDV